MKNLERLAEAMDTELYYAFVPRNSFERVLRDQAERVAEQVVQGVEQSMALEAQGTQSEAQSQRKADLAAEYARSTPRDLWDPK